MEEHALISDESKWNFDIVLDTGATNHIFHNKSLFHSMATTNKSVNIASGHSIPVSGVCNVRFEIYDYRSGRSRKTIEMNNVWYVPSCTRNLVSGVQLVSKGFNICSSNGGVSVLSPTGDVIATARLKGGLCHRLCLGLDWEQRSPIPIGYAAAYLRERVISCLFTFAIISLLLSI